MTEERLSHAIMKAQALVRGDRVALICPSGRPASASVVQRCLHLVEEMGFTPIVGRHVKSIFGPMAGQDAERLQDLHSALEDESVRGIFCISGGWGALRLLPQLNFDQVRKFPKVMVGCDENTSLLSAINTLTGLVVLHGPNLDQIKSRYSFKKFVAATTGKEPLDTIKCVDSADDLFERAAYAPVSGIAEGTTAGGNLSAVSSLFGTPYQPILKDSIVCLEDINEYNGTLDRWLTNIYLSGRLKEVAGIAFGSFVNCNGKGAENSLPLEDTSEEMLKSTNRPSCFGLKFGQTKDTNVVPIGIKTRLNSQAGTLEFLEPALI